MIANYLISGGLHLQLKILSLCTEPDLLTFKGTQESIPSLPGKTARARIFKRLWSPEIDSRVLIPPSSVAWRAGTITLFLLGS